MRTVYVGAAGLRGCPWCGVPKGMTLHPLIGDKIVLSDVRFQRCAFGPTVTVPEPSSLWLFGVGLFGMGLFARRRARAAP